MTVQGHQVVRSRTQWDDDSQFTSSPKEIAAHEIIQD